MSLSDAFEGRPVWCEHCRADRQWFHSPCPGNVDERAARADAAEAELRLCGSRARYRRTVEAFAREQERQAARCASQGGLVVTYRDCLHRDHAVSMRRIAGWHRNAARRARRILAALDGAR